MSEPVKSIPAPDFPTPAIAQKAEAALAAYRAIRAGLNPPLLNPPLERPVWAGRGSLRDACAHGDAAMVKFYLDDKTFSEWLYLPTPHGEDFQRAIRHGYSDVVCLLIERAAEIQIDNIADLRARYMDEAVMAAVRYCSCDMMRRLIGLGADIRVRNDVLIQAAAMNAQGEMMQLLIEQGADINSWDKDNYLVTKAVRSGSCSLMRLLIERGKTIGDGEAVIKTAAENYHFEMVFFLIEQSADIDSWDKDNYLVKMAAGSGNCDLMRLLIGRGKTIGDGKDAIKIAAMNGHPEMMRFLIDHGAHENVLSEQQKKDLARYDFAVSRWRQVLRRDPLQYLLHDDPWLFKGACYESVRRMLREEKYLDGHCAKIAFHTAALFQSPDRVLQYLKQWGRPGTQPLHDLVYNITVPSALSGEAKPNLKDWADGVLKCGPSMAKFVVFANRVSSPVKTDDGRTWSMVKTREACARFGFKRAEENIALAGLCFEHNVDEKTFEDALAIVKGRQATAKNIPDLAFDGRTFDMPGGKFRRLADGDVKGLFLGQMTDCCQSIGGAGRNCAKHGFTSAEGGFYVVENAKGRIVGQSWAWRGEQGELCLDSLETLGQNVNGDQWMSIVNAFRDALSSGRDHNVTALTIGTSGATSNSCPNLKSAFNDRVAAKPCDYNGYRDSHNQILIWRAPHV